MWTCLLSCQVVVGDYELSVAVHAYQNPSHRAANGICCDLFCSLSCDNYFVFCLRASEEEEGCGLGELHTGEVGGGDNLTLSPGDGSSMGRQPNPMTVSSSGAWMVRTTLVMEQKALEMGLAIRYCTTCLPSGYCLPSR